VGMGTRAQIAAVPEKHLCLPYLRNGALGAPNFREFSY
jgi:hypothetical protein